MPDGTMAYYSYSDAGVGNPWTYPFQRTTTMGTGPVLPRKIETYDGLGRVIKTKLQEAQGYRYIVTETQYTACSCGPVGKAVKVSRPYFQGTETPAWIETHFDALGRPTEVIPPDHNTGSPPRNSKTTYTYSVDSSLQPPVLKTLVTAPLGKLKRYLHDAFGRLVRVEEQNAGGTLVETARYSYDYMGRMTKVQMGLKPDGTFKQTRTFVYNTKGQLTSANNPENGTVTYTYSANGLVASKTDAKGQTQWFYFNGNRKLASIASPLGTIKTSFGYNANRLMWAANDGYTWNNQYDIMGRVTAQTLVTPFQSGDGSLLQTKATYAYNGIASPRAPFSECQ